MKLRLLHRPRHLSAAPSADPTACHCVIPHPLTAAGRERVDLAQLRARRAGETYLADRLALRLSTPCRTAAGPVCPCGCGRPPGQHNPQNSELRSAA